MPPPPSGMVQVWNFSVLGSKRTILLGRVLDSTYQMTSLITVMPYGCDWGPLGPSHDLTSPVLGLKRESLPLLQSPYQIMSSEVTPMRRMRVLGSGRTNSVTFMVFGSTVAILLVPQKLNQGCLPSERKRSA